MIANKLIFLDCSELEGYDSLVRYPYANDVFSLKIEQFVLNHI